MKKRSLVIFVSLLSLSGASFAQRSSSSEIRESTDPAKAAEVERQAAEIAQSQSSGESGGAAKHKSHAGSHEKKHGAKRGAGKEKAGESTSGSSTAPETSGGADQNPPPSSK